jgi:putative acetyltransferase
MIYIRLETPRDISRVHDINEKAFGQSLEADLVDRLRRSCPDALSLVAEEDGLILGHIMFTPVVINDRERKIRGMGLAPMAVQPVRQRQGIGSKLVVEGLEILRDRGCPYVIVLGHPEYYPKFGFEPASRYGIESQ